MNEYKNLLLQYILKKDSIIFKDTNIHLINSNEITHLLNFNEEQIIGFFENLEIDWKDDKNLCPWCYLYFSVNDNCKYCSYAVHKMTCFDPNSTYEQIIDNTKKECISDIPGIKNLAIKTIKQFNKIKTQIN